MNNDIDNGSANKHTIQLDLRCKLEDGQTNGLIQLLNELTPLTLGDAVNHLHAVIVVNDGNVERTVNELIRDVGKRSETYSAGQHVANAVAVPIELDAALICFVVLSSSNLQSVTSDKYHPVNLVSSLLEELLHISVYSKAWQRRGTIFPLTTNLLKRDITTLCTRFHDEYIVARWKASIAATMPLFDASGGLTPGSIFYPNRMAPYLEKAKEDFVYLISEMSTGKISVSDAWSPILNVIYRYIFEPLSRDAGFRDGNTEQSSIPWNANEAVLYCDVIELYWLSIKRSLGTSFTSGLNDADGAIELIVDNVSGLLEQLGLLIEGDTLRYVETPFLAKFQA